MDFSVHRDIVVNQDDLRSFDEIRIRRVFYRFDPFSFCRGRIEGRIAFDRQRHIEEDDPHCRIFAELASGGNMFGGRFVKSFNPGVFDVFGAGK